RVRDRRRPDPAGGALGQISSPARVKPRSLAWVTTLPEVTSTSTGPTPRAKVVTVRVPSGSLSSTTTQPEQSPPGVETLALVDVMRARPPPGSAHSRPTVAGDCSTYLPGGLRTMPSARTSYAKSPKSARVPSRALTLSTTSVPSTS